MGRSSSGMLEAPAQRIAQATTKHYRLLSGQMVSGGINPSYIGFLASFAAARSVWGSLGESRGTKSGLWVAWRLCRKGGHFCPPFAAFYRSNHHRLRNFGGVNMSQTENPVIPFAPGTSSNGGDQLDKAGRSIINLLHKAAGAAEQNSQHAMDMAQKLSHQLVAAEQRITDLEGEVEGHRERADRAEQWLHRVYTEIEDRFVRRPSGRARTMAR